MMFTSAFPIVRGKLNINNEICVEKNMRKIKGKCLETMVSPIRYVMAHIHEALVNIAPENKERFESEYPEFILEYKDTDVWILGVNNSKHILLSRRVVEIFWGAAYGYATFYTKIVQGKKYNRKTVTNLHNNSEVKEAMLLLKWVYESWLNKECASWPDNLPKPEESPQQGSMENVATELCLCSIAYLVHHELAHIRLKHAGCSTISIEKEADFEATDWLLNHSLDEWDDKFIKRALGIAMAFEVLTARGIYTGDYGGISHPYSYDRLFHNLEKYITDPQHLVWAFICSTLKLHLDNKKIETPEIEYKDFKECVNSYLDLLSRNTQATTN